MRSTVTMVGTALLSACTTVGPNYATPAADVPSHYAEGHPSQLTDYELTNWWRAFNDPRLNDLVNRAIAQNLDVQSAAARIREARAQEQVAGAASKPQMDFTPSISRQRISENAIPIPPGSSPNQGSGFGLPGAEFTNFRLGFDASWEIDLFGRTKRSVEAAQARTGAALWNRRDVQVSIAAEVARSYFHLRTLQQRIVVAEAELARQQRSERLIQARVRGGLVIGQDLEQQQSERSEAASASPSLRAEARQQVHALGVLTGTAPESLIGALEQPSPISFIPSVPAGLPSDLVRRRPDIRAAERELAAATADIGIATADLYPRFSLTAAPALVSTALGKLLEWGSRSYSVGGALAWPLLDGGRTRGNIAVANARQEQAVIAYRKAVLTALQDVEDALSRVDGDRQKLAQLEQAVGDAARAEQIAETRFRGGLVTYSDVLAARARRLRLDDQVSQTRGASAQDSAALFKALGGGWPELGGEQQ